jgi:hypothetical protein
MALEKCNTVNCRDLLDRVAADSWVTRYNAWTPTDVVRPDIATVPTGTTAYGVAKTVHKE